MNKSVRGKEFFSSLGVSSNKPQKSVCFKHCIP